MLGGLAADSIIGSAHADELIGTGTALNPAPRDTLRGFGGDDLLYGFECDGGTGNDTLAGSAPDSDGNVTPVGILSYESRTSEDSVSYDGNDPTVIRVGSDEEDHLPDGFKRLYCGPGNDQIINLPNDSSQTIFGEGGNDVIRMKDAQPPAQRGSLTVVPATMC